MDDSDDMKAVWAQEEREHDAAMDRLYGHPTESDSSKPEAVDDEWLLVGHLLDNGRVHWNNGPPAFGAELYVRGQAARDNYSPDTSST